MLKSPVFKFFASLKLAVFSIMLLAVVLTVATCLESLYGTRAVHVLVYGTPWFAGVLFLLGLNVFCAAMSRYPWKKSQFGFALTHLGIIILLLGSVITQKFGVDANMPVTEGNQENQVTLNDLVLLVIDESKNIKREYPITESYRESVGRSLSVDFGGGAQVAIDRFVPRAVAETVLQASPVEGLGSPGLKLELFNSRFHLEENVFVQHPSKPTQVNLGPALISFQILNSPEEKKRFLEPPVAAKQPSSTGFLVANLRGKEYRVSIDEAQSRFISFSGGDYEVKVDQYFPYAVVENNQLVNRSDEPKNPALHLTVRKRGSADLESQEQHTIFANFPEFSTLHGAHKKTTTLGIKFRIEMGKDSNPSLAIVGTSRGQLAFGQTADGKQLFYRTQGKDGRIKAKGEIKPEVVTPTGWMDLQFRVKEWMPSAVEVTYPRSIEYISGSGDNYLSAIHLVENREISGSPGNAESATSGWLFEGQGKLLNLGGREVFIQFSRKRLTLPFYLFLEKFKMGTDPGTMKAASYQSDVEIKDLPNRIEKKANISMNEPLKYGGYTFYQASYSLEEGKPAVSVFAVNFDPGRQIKYLGSLIMTLGILVMFYMNPHYLSLIFKRKGQQP
jgi:ResB-like family